MLTTPRAQLVEKMITSEDGIVFKAFFLVYEEEGRVKARLVRAVPVSKKQNAVVFALTGDVLHTPCIEIKSDTAIDQIISPYSSLLYFSGSKPRAPTR
jgi:hypothetical protein